MGRRSPSVVRHEEAICRTHERAVHFVPGVSSGVNAAITVEHGPLEPGFVARELGRWDELARRGAVYRPGSDPCGELECCGPGPRRFLEQAIGWLPARAGPAACGQARGRGLPVSYAARSACQSTGTVVGASEADRVAAIWMIICGLVRVVAGSGRSWRRHCDHQGRVNQNVGKTSEMTAHATFPRWPGSGCAPAAGAVKESVRGRPIQAGLLRRGTPQRRLPHPWQAGSAVSAWAAPRTFVPARQARY
jgi:hypothetical protein